MRPPRQFGAPSSVSSTCRHSRQRPSSRAPVRMHRCPRAASAARRCATRSSTSACRRCARATCRRSASTAMEPFYPLHAKVCESCLLVQLEEFVAAEDDLQRVRVLLVVLRLVGRARPRLRRRWRSSDSGSTRTASSWSSRATTATCCSTSWSAGIPALGHRAGRQRRQGGAGARDRDASSSSSAASWPVELAAEGRRADLLARQQRHGPRSRPQRLRRRHSRSCWPPDGVVTIEVPHLLRLVEEQPVRHDLPRALLVLLAADRAAVLAAHGLELFDVDELKSHGGSLRLYAQHAATGRQAGRARAWRSWPSASAASASTRSRRTSPFTAQVKETKWRLLEFLIASRREGKRIAGYGAPGKGNTLLNFCGIRTDLLDVHGRSQPVQAGPVPAGDAHPDPAPRGARAGSARLHPDPAVEPQGRDRRAARLRARMGSAGSSSRSRRWRCCEGRHLLRRPGHADARGIRASCPSRWSRSATGRSSGT